jgi:hypothetical protein
MKLCSIALSFLVAISGAISTAEGAQKVELIEEQGGPTRSTVGKKKGKTTTASPVAPTLPTLAPIRVQVNYYLQYYSKLRDQAPTDQDYVAITELTRVYLKKFMKKFIANSGLILDDFITSLIRIPEGGGILYGSTALFKKSSSNFAFVVPTENDLYYWTTEAFRGGNLTNYLALVQDLSSENFFSSTSVVELIVYL